MRIGTDIVEIDRIRRSVQKQGFLRHVYSKEEMAFFETKKDPAPSMAANWAAKEAFSKALGTGVVGFEMHDISVLRDKLGAPYLSLSGNAKEIADKMGLTPLVTLSHSDKYAVAFVVCEENKND
ncbi:MAG: holo-ACP synthase [Ruminococcus sp.]|nr:holo-ACP synthase [Ruminococcus sp.]